MNRKKSTSPITKKPTAFSDTDDEDISGSNTVMSRGNNLERYPLLSSHGDLVQDEPYSDSEAMNVRTQARRSYQQQVPYQLQAKLQSASSNWANPNKYSFARDSSYKRVIHENEVFTDDDGDRDDHESVDEFAPIYAGNVIFPQLPGNKLVKTGRQRKKNAARTKGGEFQSRRKKKRLYFCCVGSEIDVQQLYDHLISSGALSSDWQYRMYSDVLHIHKPGHAGHAATPSAMAAAAAGSTQSGFRASNPSPPAVVTASGKSIQSLVAPAPFSPLSSEYASGSALSVVQESTQDSDERASSVQLNSEVKSTGGVPENVEESSPGPTNRILLQRHASEEHVLVLASDGVTVKVVDNNPTLSDDLHTRISGSGAQEVFVFDFGAVVFWGFPRGEEAALLRAVRMFVTKGAVEGPEFESGEDDMAYVSSPEVETVTIANDVLLLPEESPAKQRLSVSFAIAQSSVLAIFESRIDRKIVDYKYIPEHMATYGRIELTERQLGTMIGEVFVIRHDVNLHTEILDIPDFFWKDGEKFEGDYKLVSYSLVLCSSE